MNDIDFRNTLVKALELDRTPISEKTKVLSTLLKSNTYIEYTSIFTRREWDTYCAILHIQVPVENYELIKNSESKLLSVAEKIFGKQGDHYLTDVETGIIIRQPLKTHTIEQKSGWVRILFRFIFIFCRETGPKGAVIPRLSPAC